MKFGNLTFVLFVLVQTPSIFAAPSTCEAVPTVSSCVKAISSSLTKTKSVSAFCSSILGCTTTPTTTLAGTVTITSTQLVVETWTQEEIASETTTSSTYTDSTTLSKPISTRSLTSTYTFEKFAVTTIKPKRRDELHPRDLAARATTIGAACHMDVQKKACSCLVTCPTTVTKDNRKTVKEKTTETSYQGTTVGITYTNIEYIPIPTTETVLYTYTTTKIVVATNTRTVKCTPSVTNPSFYLYATNAPPVNNRYVQAYPAPWQRDIFPSHKDPRYTRYKDEASLFYLDDSSRLLTAGKDSTTYGQIDYFNNFQLFSFLSRNDIQIHGYLYAACTIDPPSGLYAGNYKELTCRTNGYWDNHYFQFCPLYVDYYNNGLVLGSERSPTSPDCLDIVFLVIPACES